MIEDPGKVLTGTGMDHRIEHPGAKQVRCQLEERTVTMTKWDVMMSLFPIVTFQRLKMRCNKAVFVSCVENKDGNRTELELQANGKVDNKWACDINSVQMRAPEGQAKRTDYAANSSSMKQWNIRTELIQTEAYGQMIRVRP